ncbi:MAG: hypothetical protein CMH12_03425 [Maritimibacter sp.]|nr:hypothetical protein [Maritimibacter sp.]
MPKFTETQIFPNATEVYPDWKLPAAVVIDAGSGSIAIEADQGDGTFVAIPDSPFSADAVFHLRIANLRLRFTVTGDATYGFTA